MFYSGHRYPSRVLLPLVVKDYHNTQFYPNKKVAYESKKLKYKYMKIKN